MNFKRQSQRAHLYVRQLLNIHSVKRRNHNRKTAVEQQPPYGVAVVAQRLFFAVVVVKCDKKQLV